MIRLHFIVEGQTEKAFVDKILTPHLFAARRIVADTRVVHTNWKLQMKGGMTSYTRAKKDVVQWMSSDRRAESYFTTMFDLYALPDDFPMFQESKSNRDPYARIEILERGFAEDIASHRFIPYIQLHEFEALLFADASQFDWEFLEHDSAIQKLSDVAAEFENPELINDHPNTAPSKRIIRQIPEYEFSKSSVGPLVAEKIGLSILRQKCRHFNQWITKLEALT